MKKIHFVIVFLIVIALTGLVVYFRAIYGGTKSENVVKKYIDTRYNTNYKNIAEKTSELEGLLDRSSLTKYKKEYEDNIEQYKKNKLHSFLTKQNINNIKKDNGFVLVNVRTEVLFKSEISTLKPVRYTLDIQFTLSKNGFGQYSISEKKLLNSFITENGNAEFDEHSHSHEEIGHTD